MKSHLWSFLLVLIAITSRSQSVDPTRLSPMVCPAFEQINLTIDPHLDSYAGDVAIEVTTSSAADSIRLHGEGFQIHSASIAGVAGAQPLEAMFRDNGYLVLRTRDVISPGRYTVRLNFTGKYRRGSEGINKFRRDGLEYVATQMESIYARTAFPCFDEPHFKILYQMTLNVPERMFAASNMLVRSETYDSGFRKVVFDTTLPTPSYLLAFVVGPFDTLSISGTPIPVRLIGPKGYLKPAPLVAEHLPRIIQTLEEYAGIPFPFPKLDLAYVSGYGGLAMENSGLIIFDDRYGEKENPNMPNQQRRRDLTTTAHEIAHMWCGDLVTLDWWDDTWLNEGLTTWMSNAVMEDLFPALSVEEDVKSDFRQSRDADVSGTVQCVRQSYRGDENVDASLSSGGTLSYQKPNTVLRMAEGWVGRPELKKILRTYLRAHTWRTATTDDYLAAARQVGGAEVPLIIEDYVMQPGIPCVQFALRGNDSLALRQDRYRGICATKLDQNCWHIPVTLRLTRGGRTINQRIFFTGRDTVVRLEGAGEITLLVPNVGQSGYYISRISPALSESLLRSGVCSVREKEDLLTDLQYLNRAGLMSPVDIFHIGERLHPANDSSLAPAWISLLTSLRETYAQAERKAMLHPVFQAQALPILEQYGYAPIPGENETIRKLRWDAIRLVPQRKDLRSRLASIGRMVLLDTTRTLTRDDRDYLVEFALLHGSDSLQCTLLRRLVRSHDAQEREILAFMAGVHQGEGAFKRNIDFINTNDPQPVERLMLLWGIDVGYRNADDTLSHRRFIEWIRAHEPELRKLVTIDVFEPFFLSRLMWNADDILVFEKCFPPEKHSRAFQDAYKERTGLLVERAKLQEKYGHALDAYAARWHDRLPD